MYGQFYVGAESGATFSSPQVELNARDLRTGIQNGYTINLGAGYQFEGRWRVESNLKYIGTGFTLNSIPIEVDADYLGLDLNTNLLLTNLEEPLRFFTSFGLQYNFLLDQHKEIKVMGLPDDVDDGPYYLNDQNDFLAGLEFGVEYVLKRYTFLFALGGQLSLLDFNDTSIYASRHQNRYATISLGLHYHFKTQ